MLAHLATQLDAPPTVAVLTRVNSFAGRISEGLTREEERNGEQLAPVDHILYWDPELAAAAALVVASILEWPTLAAKDAVARTLECIADYYRVKVGLGTSGSSIEDRHPRTRHEGSRGRKSPASKTAKVLLEAAKVPPPLTGRSVTDWHIARAALRGSAELDELAAKARLVRLLNATGAVAWALSGTWNRATGYTGSVDAVRAALAAEAVNVQQPDEAPVHVMTMHKSKGKEFDAVVIVEGRHDMPLLDPLPESKAQEADRRLLRVAITRARHLVTMIRPTTALPLTPSARPGQTS